MLGLTSGLQGSVNVHRGALLLVTQWECISSFVFYYATGSSFFNNHRWKIKVIWPRSYEKKKSNEKERIFIYLAIDPKGQGDFQGHMIFYMTYKLYGLSRSLWPFCDSIQRIIREISAIESLMTSCLLDRKWHKKCFLRNKVIVILPLLKQVWFRSDSK